MTSCPQKMSVSGEDDAACGAGRVCAAGDSLLCVTDEAAPTFYIAKHVTDDPAVGRDIGSLQSLWRASEQTPENVLMDVGPLGAGEDRYHLFRIVGRPYALSAKVLAGLNSTQKRQIINGIVGSIYTLHHFMPPLPHRGLRPGCYYVCRQGANCRAVLALFSTIKDNTAEKTVYGAPEHMPEGHLPAGGQPFLRFQSGLAVDASQEMLQVRVALSISVA